MNWYSNSKQLKENRNKASSLQSCKTETDSQKNLQFLKRVEGIVRLKAWTYWVDVAFMVRHC